MQRLYIKIEKEYPQKPCYKTINKHILALISRINLKAISVVELGGYNGSLANEILSQSQSISKWHNYEIIPNLIQLCNDHRYNYNVLVNWFWSELDKKVKCDLFVASHVLEHLKKETIKLVLEKISAKYIAIEVPIAWGKQGKWTDTISTHILDIGRQELIDLFAEFKYYPILLFANDNAIVFQINYKRKYGITSLTDIFPYKHPEVPNDIDAWITRKEISKLQEYCKDRIYCEIGSYEGFSGFMINKVANKVIMIDPLPSDSKYGKVIKYVVKPNESKCVFIRDYSQNVHNWFDDESFDVLLIDGNHNLESVKRDYDLYRAKVKIGGYIVFHDYNFTGVGETVDNYVTDEYIETCETMVIFKRNK